MDHAELLDALWTRIFPHLGMVPDEGAIEAMQALSRHHTRMPGVPFLFARDPNRGGAADFRGVAERVVGPVMEALRTAEAAPMT